MSIFDAVQSANVLVPLLRAGERIEEFHLARIQARRERPTRLMQALQKIVGQRVLAGALADPEGGFRLPGIAQLLLRIPGLRSLPARLVAFGGRRTPLEITAYFQG